MLSHFGEDHQANGFHLSKKMLILAITMKSTPFLGRPPTFRIFGMTVLDVVWIDLGFRGSSALPQNNPILISSVRLVLSVQSLFPILLISPPFVPSGDVRMVFACNSVKTFAMCMFRFVGNAEGLKAIFYLMVLSLCLGFTVTSTMACTLFF